MGEQAGGNGAALSAAFSGSAFVEFACPSDALKALVSMPEMHVNNTPTKRELLPRVICRLDSCSQCLEAR